MDISHSRQLIYRQVKCKICYGTGRDPAVGSTCKQCGGKGWRLFPEGATEKCVACEGRGKDHRFSVAGVVCPECDGFGEVKQL